MIDPNKIFTKLAFFLTIIFTFTAYGQDSPDQENIFAIVNGEKIPMTLFQTSVNYKLLYKSFIHGGDPSETQIQIAEKEATARLIDRTLIIQELKRNSNLPNQEKINEYLEGDIRSYGGEEKLGNFLSSAKINWEGYRRMMTDIFLTKWFINTSVYSETVVNKDQCREYYDNNIAVFRPPGKALVDIFKFSVPDGSIDSKSADAIKAIAKLEDIDGIHSAVNEFRRQKSNAPIRVEVFRSMRWEGSKGNFIMDAVSGLKPGGAVYARLKDSVDYILYLHTIDIPHQTTFDEAKDNIERTLKNQQARKLLEKKIIQLRQNADIQIFYKHEKK